LCPTWVSKHLRTKPRRNARIGNLHGGRLEQVICT
jgi:hypothetical protein